MNSEGSCVHVAPGPAVESKQGHQLFQGISAESAGSRALCMYLVHIPPGGRARAHFHANHESAIYVLEGDSITWYGDRLQHQVRARAGEFVYIPPGVPHLPVNASEVEPLVGLVARTDPNEQESVVLLPELDEMRSR